MDKAKVKRETEKVRISGVVIEDLLNEKFLKKIKEKETKIIPIFLALNIPKEKNIVVLTHENEKEVEDKILHINSGTQQTLDTFVKILEEINK
ncbi:MAG: hypothetical protein U9Q92_01700 [archaeon]|nr:hypothetical protein [archaeon]